MMRFFLVAMIFPSLVSVGICEEEARSPKELARELLTVYGKRLDDTSYIPALGVYGRLRYGELAGEPTYREEVLEIIAPYRQRTPAAKSDPNLAGHLLFAAAAKSVGKDEANAWKSVVLAAIKQRFGGEVGNIKPPDNVMSDAVFMIAPILCEAGLLTSDEKHSAAAIRYLRELRKLRVRDDGLYRHGHLCDAAWGRGNGFPAVGVAWCLTALPKGADGRNELLAAYRQHMAALAKQQDKEGMWHQVIDVPDSYAEFSCTCMIGFAMQRGIREGWLNAEEYQPLVDKAWVAICNRIEPEGKLRGVCEGTGTQPSLEAYLKRKAIHDVDPRGGAMALLFATERMAVEKR